MEFFVISAKFVPLKYYTLSSQLRRLTSFSVALFGSANYVTRSYPVMRKSCIRDWLIVQVQHVHYICVRDWPWTVSDVTESYGTRVTRNQINLYYTKYWLLWGARLNYKPKVILKVMLCCEAKLRGIEWFNMIIEEHFSKTHSVYFLTKLS